MRTNACWGMGGAGGGVGEGGKGWPGRGEELRGVGGEGWRLRSCWRIRKQAAVSRFRAVSPPNNTVARAIVVIFWDPYRATRTSSASTQLHR